MGCWSWWTLLPHSYCAPIPSPLQLKSAMRRVLITDLATFSLLFFCFRARTAMAVAGWMIVRFTGVYTLHRYGWYWLAQWTPLDRRWR